MLSVARRSAVKSRTQAANQTAGLIVTAGEHLKDRPAGQGTASLVETCTRWRPDPSPDHVTAAAKTALRSLARRHQALTGEIAQLDAELLELCEHANPALGGACGVGPDVAAALLVTAGDNPHRMRNKASVAALCGASPTETSPGATVRHRLNRSGNRHANNALWRIAITPLRVDQRTIDYAQRRRAHRKTRREIIRCLKRHTARDIYRLLTDPPQTPHGADLRRARQHARLTHRDTGQALNVPLTRIPEPERGLRHNNDLAKRYQQHLAQLPTRHTKEHLPTPHPAHSRPQAMPNSTRHTNQNPTSQLGCVEPLLQQREAWPSTQANQ